jgi:NAD(P)-dependent dehydrogenase (short-subunit alcohol dehydrogenase family)
MTSAAEVTVQEPASADLLASPPVLPGITAETVVLITGGSGAIGSRTAAVLSAIGARVTIMARAPERVAQAAAEAQHAGQVLGAAGDISVPDDITRVVTETVREFGRLDAVVNLAAVGDSAARSRTSPSMRSTR